MALDLIFLVVGIAFIFWGARYLINSVVFFSKELGVPSLVIGLTIVAFGTSTPELSVGVWSALRGDASLSFGNVIGANLANIGLIVGLVALLHPVKIKTSSLKKEFPFVILAPVMLYLLAVDGLLSQMDGIILLIMAFLFIYYAVWTAGHGNGEIISRIRALHQPGAGRTDAVMNFFYSVIGLILLILGSRLLVTGAVSLAASLGVSNIVIGVTVITIGTALPELFTSLVALLKGREEISLGNVIGSTIFNIFIILGTVLVISPIAVPQAMIDFDLLFLILFTLVLVALLRTSDRIAQIEGAVLVVAYFSYISYLIYVSRLTVL